MGMRGRKLVEQNYAWPHIAAQMIEVYKWVLSPGTKARLREYQMSDLGSWFSEGHSSATAALGHTWK